jgi:uncharacterized protein YbjT (DUF2867 family)
VVFGATGKQGGAIIDTLKKDNKYHIRGVSRTTHHAKAAKLRENGVEMIEADICSGQGLDDVFKDVYAAFLVTNSFEKGIEGNEFECGKKLVDKARANGVQILVWSSSPYSEKFEVPQYTEKAKVEQYIKEIQKSKAFQAVTFITPTFYFQNFARKGFCPKRDNKGTYTFKLPSVNNLVGCDVNDIGPIFKRILNDPEAFNCKTVVLDGDQGNMESYVQNFEKVTKQSATFSAIKPEELEKCPELHHGKELANMFKFISEHPFPPTESDTIPARKIYPEIKNFTQWLEHSGWRGDCNPQIE